MTATIGGPWQWRITLAILGTIAAQVLTHRLWWIFEPTPFLLGFVAATLVSAATGRAAGLLTVAFGLVGYILFPLPDPVGGAVELIIGYTLVSGTFSWIVAGRYQALAALRESEHRLRSMVTSLPVVFWAIVQDGPVGL